MAQKTEMERKRGRKHRYYEKVHPHLEQIGKWCEEGLTEKQIAQNLRVGYSTFAKYKAEFIELLEALKSKAVADDQVENALFKRATGFGYEEITQELATLKDQNGDPILVPVYDSQRNIIGEIFKKEMVVTKIVTKHQSPDTGAAAFWLKNRRPERWRDKREIDHTIHNDYENMSDEELEAAIEAEFEEIREMKDEGKMIKDE